MNVEVKTRGGPVRRFPSFAEACNYLRGAAYVSPKAQAQVAIDGKKVKGTARELAERIKERGGL